MGNVKRGEFYEDDEPVEDVVTAFDAGEKFLTARPVEHQRGWTRFLRLKGEDPVDTYLQPGAQARLA